MSLYYSIPNLERCESPKLKKKKHKSTCKKHNHKAGQAIAPGLSQLGQINVGGVLPVETGVYQVGGLEVLTNGIVVDGGGVLVTSGGINVNGGSINNVATPVLASDAVNKAYVDASTSNLFDGSLPPNVLLQSDSNGKVQASTISMNSGNVGLPGGLNVSGLAASSFVFTDSNKNLVSTSQGNLDMKQFSIQNVGGMQTSGNAPTFDMTTSTNGNSGVIKGLADPTLLTMPVTLNYANNNLVNLTGTQTITGQKTFTSPIVLKSPTLLDSNSNPMFGQVSATLSANSNSAQTIATISGLNLSSSALSTIALQLFLTVNDPVLKNGIISIPILKGGLGYLSAPVVTITDVAGGPGTGATATSTLINGALAAINILTTGQNYANPIVTVPGGATIGKAVLGNVFGAVKWSPIFNVSATSAPLTAPLAILENVQSGEMPTGFALNAVFNPLQPVPNSSNAPINPSITVTFNTAGYPNALSANLVWILSCTAPK